MNEKRDSQILILKSDKSLQEERIQALFQLMNIADDLSLDAIFECLKVDTCEIVRHEAAFVLGECASARAIEELREAIVNDSSDVVKHEALLALGTISEKDLIPFIKSIEEDNNYSHFVRESAKVALQRLNNTIKPYRGPDEFEYLKE
jgi:deoxyhypusine monooxygenase